MHIDSADYNNTFGFVFKTIANDENGLFQIL